MYKQWHFICINSTFTCAAITFSDYRFHVNQCITCVCESYTHESGQKQTQSKTICIKCYRFPISRMWECAVSKCHWKNVLLWKDSDNIVTIWRSDAFTSMFLTVNLVLNKKVSFLFQVDPTVCADVAFWVTKSVSNFDHHSPSYQKKECIN